MHDLDVLNHMGIPPTIFWISIEDIVGYSDSMFLGVPEMEMPINCSLDWKNDGT